MKKATRWTLALALCLGLAKTASAVEVSDSLTATIRPNAFYAVDIATAGTVEALALGTVDLAASTQTVSPATVTVQSTFNETELTLIGDITCSGVCTPWSFDANDASGETNALQAWAVFTDTGTSVMPAKGAGGFSGGQPGLVNSDMFDGSARDVGDNDDTFNMFERDSGAGNKDMDRLPPDTVDAGAAASHLWLNFTLPPAITVDNAGDDQFITVTLTAKVPD